MSLTVGTLEASEISDFVQIQLTAFTSVTSRILYAPSPETADQTRSLNLEYLKNNSHVQFQKAFDPVTGDIASCARWKIYLNGRDEADVTLGSPDLLQEAALGWQGQAKRAFHETLSRYLRDIMGTRPFYHLDMLMTDPRFSRRGAAQKLIEWGIGQANRRQLPIYLESSVMAQPLYQRNGFQPVGDYTMDLAKFGGAGVEKVIIMIRMPRSTHQRNI
ncbi:hypothetical protein N7448_011057 [Penicillium atrosanguineum]|nr:hypothetical protein N7448_011057 [Penicillium atrosanguineum]